MARLIRARKAGSPLIVIPTAPSGAVVLEAVKAWPGKGGVRRKVWATANLDSSCARRPLQYCGSGRRNGTPGRTKKPIKKERCAALKPLDKKGPIQGRFSKKNREAIEHERAILRGIRDLDNFSKSK